MNHHRILLPLIVASSLATGSCRSTPDDKAVADLSDTTMPRLQPLNLAAGTQVLYEVQLRSANACDPTIGADWQRAACRSKIAPRVTYRAAGMQCGILPELERIKLGTIDDMLADTADYRRGITVRYVHEKVGATMLWVMPPFPNNDIEQIPDACDNMGSPYAVRDYLHMAGTLSRACINAGRDEYSPTPCWANDEFDRLIAASAQRNIKVMLDLAFNHIGHQYRMYDYFDFRTVNDRIAAGEDLNRLWQHGSSEDPLLLRPRLLDTPEKLAELVAARPARRAELDALRARCPTLAGDKLVIAFNAWRNALPHERERFPCADADNLERAVPGFFMGSDRNSPSTGPLDMFTNNWRDVRFLFHNEGNPLKQHEFVRNREYLFRIMNWWTYRGIAGYRLDHATNDDSKLSPNIWNYIIGKTNHYAARRGQAKPIYMAEEFHNQLGMDRVVDFMTEGYVFAMNGRNVTEKNTSHVERVVNDMGRFPNQSFVMTALETHDEHRLTDGTGFNRWTGAGFWGIGATTRSTPMLLMGQEFGETWGLGFRRSDFLRARFVGSQTWNPEGEQLATYYRTMIKGRLAAENRALYSHNYRFLRARSTNAPDERIFAMAKWSDDANAVFVFHNLWEQSVQQNFFIPADAANAMMIRDAVRYRLRDIITNRQMGDCRTGAELKWDLPVIMDRATRAQWLRLETCP